jgi:hypothetical protein
LKDAIKGDEKENFSSPETSTPSRLEKEKTKT